MGMQLSIVSVKASHHISNVEWLFLYQTQILAYITSVVYTGDKENNVAVSKVDKNLFSL
jgi:hypothetical protein